MQKNLLVFYFILIMLIPLLPLDARTSKTRDKTDNTQRVVGSFDVRRNGTSNVEFYHSNYGIFGLNVNQNVGGLYWPRSPYHEYLFGSGYWFGAQVYRSGNLKKLVESSYNPNDGTSIMVPGQVKDGDNLKPLMVQKYQLYTSKDYDLSTGQTSIAEDGPNWPVWYTDTTDKFYYKGFYVSDDKTKDFTNYPGGPVFISDEDFHCVFKDSDLSRYSTKDLLPENPGFPLRMQYEQSVYAWNSEEYKDMVITYVKLINSSTDTLYDCWFAPMYDVDIALSSNAQEGATNDRLRFYDEDESLNLTVGWSETDKGELNQGFGYIGISLLMSPGIGGNDYIRKDKQIFDRDEQVPLNTFRNWPITMDSVINERRYDFIAAGTKDNDNSTGDKRILMGIGPFNMLPGDTAKFAMLICFAMPSGGGEPNGQEADLENLVNYVNKARNLFDKNLVTSINEYEFVNSGLSVYPNPFNDRLSIRLSLPDDEPVIYSVKVVDIIGNTVKRFDLPIDLDNLEWNGLDESGNKPADGIYMVVISTSKGYLTSSVILSK